MNKQLTDQDHRFFKSAREAGLGSLSSSCEINQFITHLLSLPGSPIRGSDTDLFTPSPMVGCYEILEPLLYCRITGSKMAPTTVSAFTVVQDTSGVVFNLQLTLEHREDEDDRVRQIGAFRVGNRFLIWRSNVRLDVDGGTSLLVKEVDVHIYRLPLTAKAGLQEQGKEETEVTNKCGFCGKIGERLLQCAKCQTTYYCSKECQTVDWVELKHKWVCPFLQHPSHPFFSTVSSPLPEVPRSA